MKEQIETEIPLAWNEKRNKNGWRLSREELEKAINRKDFQERLNTGYIFIVSIFPKFAQGGYIIDPDNIIGTILSMNLDRRIVKIKINKDIDLKDQVLKCFMNAELNDNKDAKDARIICYGLMDKDMSAYYN